MDKSKKHSSGQTVMDNFDALQVHHSLRCNCIVELRDQKFSLKRKEINTKLECIVSHDMELPTSLTGV